MHVLPGWLRPYVAALRAFVVFTAVLGVAYPLIVTGVAQTAFAAKANGSTFSVDGTVRGSHLLAQSFSDAKGQPLRQWFQPRPSAVDYDATSSGASNLGPESAVLIKAIKTRRRDVAAFDSVPGHPVAPAQVPADALTTSASGLDPDISVAYAEQQVYRVAAARSLGVTVVRALVRSHTSRPTLGTFGTTVVDVVDLNLALSRLR